MARMTCLGNTEFYLDRKRDAILPVLLKTVKESKSLKSECYEFVLEYLRELPIELCRTDMEGFVPEAKKLLAISFPKRKDADFAEEAKLNRTAELRCFYLDGSIPPRYDGTESQRGPYINEGRAIHEPSEGLELTSVLPFFSLPHVVLFDLLSEVALISYPEL